MMGTRVAFVGCGFVADLYAQTLRLHPGIELVGVMDRDVVRASRFGCHYGARIYHSLQDVLSDERVEVVVNLTNPSAHFEVSHAALSAGKHVYSEKPLAMAMNQAEALVNLAESRGLCISSAPCSLLGETAQTVWRTIRSGAVGNVRVVYAELDDGMVHRMPYRLWCSASGTAWPWKDEFEVGCTLEHAGYYMTWLAAFFGPVKTVTAFSSVQVDDKQTSTPLDRQSPDFSVACLHFASGVVARLTCGVVAPHDHTLRIVGDEGVISTPDCWLYESPVYLRRLLTLRRKTMLSPLPRRLPLARSPYRRVKRWGAAQMDFARGIHDMADAVSQGRPPRLSARFSLHVNEVVLAIQNAGPRSGTHLCKTTFEPLTPETWAA